VPVGFGEAFWSEAVSPTWVPVGTWLPSPMGTGGFPGSSTATGMVLRKGVRRDGVALAVGVAVGVGVNVAVGVSVGGADVSVGAGVIVGVAV
jgi:hypothetical protein